ncbi:hypothetical protein [Nitrosovibrio tenuis]|nr:hypothetical protein [Nitrosovibrio tenuis]
MFLVAPLEIPAGAVLHAQKKGYSNIMPLIYRISTASLGLFNRWSEYIQSEKHPYLIPRITKRKHPFHLAGMTVRRSVDQSGLTSSISFPRKYCKSTLSEILTFRSNGDSLSDYPIYKAN